MATGKIEHSLARAARLLASLVRGDTVVGHPQAASFLGLARDVVAALVRELSIESWGSARVLPLEKLTVQQGNYIRFRFLHREFWMTVAERAMPRFALG